MKPPDQVNIMAQNKHALLVGHRGAGKCEPENSLRAISRGLAFNLDYIEIDIRITKDGHLILFHPKELSRITNGRGLVHLLTLSELRELKLEGDERIPTLEEALAILIGRARIMLDLKEPGYENQVLNLIKASEIINDVMIVSSYSNSLSIIKRLDRSIKLAISYPKIAASWVNHGNGGIAFWKFLPIKLLVQYCIKKTLPCYVMWIITKAKADAIVVYYILTSQKLIDIVHKNNKLIFVWPIDDIAKFNMLNEIGVDGCITNRPDLFCVKDITSSQSH